LDCLAFLLAQAIFILADSLALAAALILPLAFLAGFTDACGPFSFAHLALAAALILALAALLIFHFFFGTASAAGLVEEPNSWPSSFSSDWIFSLSVAALRNCWTDRLLNGVLMGMVLRFLTGIVNSGNSGVR